MAIIDNVSLVQQLQGFRALAAELHLDIVEFCQDRQHESSDLSGDKVVLNAICLLNSDDAACVSDCWQWLCRVIRSTKRSPATPTDFLNLGVCQSCIYFSLLRRRPPALDRMSAGLRTEGSQDMLSLPPPVRPKEDIYQNQLNQQQQQHRPATVKSAAASPGTAMPQQPEPSFHSAGAEQQNGSHAPHSNLAQSRSIAPNVSPADPERSSPVHNPAVDDPPASPHAAQGKPALSDKFIAEIQEALEDGPRRNKTHTAHPTARTARTANNRTGAHGHTPAHANLHPERVGAQPPQPGRADSVPAALRPVPSGPCDSSQHSASIAATEHQATQSAVTGAAGRPGFSQHTGGRGPGRASQQEAVDSPSKPPAPRVAHKAPPIPGPPHGLTRHAQSTAESADAHLKLQQQAAGGRAAAEGVPAHGGVAGRPHLPIQRIQFVAPEATGLSVPLEEMARKTKKAPPPGRAAAPGPSMPPSLQGPVKQPQAALLPPKPAEWAALTVSRSAWSAVPPRRAVEERPPHGTGTGNDTTVAKTKQRRLEETAGASAQAAHARRAGTTSGPTWLPPQVPCGSSVKSRRRSGGQPDRGRPAPEERGEFITKSRRTEAPSAGNDRHRDGSRYQRPAAPALASAEGRGKGGTSRMAPLPGAPPRARSPRSPSPLKLSPRTSPLLLGDDDSGDEVLPLGGGTRGLDRVHIVDDESDENPLLGEPGQGVSSAATAAPGAPSGRKAPGLPSGGAWEGYRSAQERVLSGLTPAEIAQAERKMQAEEQLPVALRVDALAAATGAMYDSLLDACKVYGRACVFCARDHPKAKGQCERLRSLPKAQLARWREICTKRHKARANQKPGPA